jgi:hypothetical protein
MSNFIYGSLIHTQFFNLQLSDKVQQILSDGCCIIVLEIIF